MEGFGPMLRRRRKEKGWSLRRLDEIAGVSYAYISQIECGKRSCSAEWAEILDLALEANGELAAAHKASAGEEDEMRRRAVLGLAAAAPMIRLDALGLDKTPVAGIEALRQDLVAALDNQPTNMAEWDEIAWNYGCTYADTSPQAFLADLRVDLMVARVQLANIAGDAARRDLQRVIARLSVFVAQTFGNLGDLRASLRWWHTARQYADASTDVETKVWVTGREVLRGIYERRPLDALISLVDETRASGPRPTVGTGGLLAGRAQALAVRGRAEEARRAMEEIHNAINHFPTAVLRDTVSMYGWPEYRLRHTESFVYTYLGDDDRAEEAHDRAIALYPSVMFRERAQVELHRALRLIRNGDTTSGATCATEVIYGLPSDQRIEVVMEVARSVADAIPVAQRQTRGAAELHQSLAASAPSAIDVEPVDR